MCFLPLQKWPIPTLKTTSAILSCHHHQQPHCHLVTVCSNNLRKKLWAFSKYPGSEEKQKKNIKIVAALWECGCEKFSEKQLATKNYINKSESTISQHAASGSAHFYQHFARTWMWAGHVSLINCSLVLRIVTG